MDNTSYQKQETYVRPSTRTHALEELAFVINNAAEGFYSRGVNGDLGTGVRSTKVDLRKDFVVAEPQNPSFQ
ncbi:hypothetical protein EW026_g5299 [Hermanssonia centrifuga]|uniref:Uncharacterized protein n=1 Tax=Hermanssonia centrifuga TaxID=98765 RepID=A0A4S4KGA4_9APHY|nr:hypothetical protein EW026_g5299 [Hermanssonia centrifuga]